MIWEPDDIDDGEDAEDITGTIAYGTALATMSNKRCGPRGKPINRAQQKELWSSGYVAGNWDENGFKARLRVTKDTFEFILKEISPLIQKVPTNFQPYPIERHRQLGLTLYRLAHGCELSSYRWCIRRVKNTRLTNLQPSDI